ncbi:YajQ family cyclic di-GMP-binding protein [Ornithinimicrobium sufpigmenti]|uniref:YajQ family cyclic di-GMP-binding protein n=1 Tax=Ornithinimicrobium sufpigmenti TaxID=2508882 RepID=UPI001036DD39|nr:MULTISPECIES: YajQ family cyclic di-GMP-binding protein [unclassified Ornithinimicrobium]
MADSSFDIVSKVDHQEVANAVNQAAKEISQRYDFKNVGASVELAGETIKMTANSEERCKAVLDVLQTKLVKRGVSLKHLDYSNDGEPRASGKEYRLEAALTEGISTENAKKVSKIIREEGPKGVKAQIQGEELRVTSKSRDDLQEVQRLLKSKELDFAIQFTNYR